MLQHIPPSERSFSPSAITDQENGFDAEKFFEFLNGVLRS